MAIAIALAVPLTPGSDYSTRSPDFARQNASVDPPWIIEIS